MVPEMSLWFVSLIEFDLKWCIHLKRSLVLYFYDSHSISARDKKKTSYIMRETEIDHSDILFSPREVHTTALFL